MFGWLIKPCRSLIWLTPEYWWRSLTRLSLPWEPIFSNCMCGTRYCPSWELVKMSAATHWIPINLELLLHGVLLYDLGLSRPLWVKLWIQKNIGNHETWAAFLLLHYCPFLHTFRIYPHDPHNTWLATTSNVELHHEEDKIAPRFVEVHWGVHFHFCLVLEGVPLFICLAGQVRDTLQVRLHALEEMSVSAIGKLQNPPNHRATIYCTVIQTSRCNPWFLPTLICDMLAANNETSMLLKHPAKCISPQDCSVIAAHPQSTQAQ